MNTFQVVALALVGFVVTPNLRALMRGQSFGRSLIWCLLWAVAAVSVLRPAFATVVAQASGIGRGADLVLYLFALVFLVSLSWSERRNLLLQAELTTLVRALALNEAFTCTTCHDPSSERGTSR